MRFFLLLLGVTLFVTAQAQFRLGIQAGYTHPYFSPGKFSNEDVSYTTSPYRGGLLGVVVENNLPGNWLLRSGLSITGKGTRLTSVRHFDSNSRFIEVHYLEVPVTVVHQWQTGKDWAVLAGAGGYAAKAVRGVERGEGWSLFGRHYGIENKLEFRSENVDNQRVPTVIQPIDYGVLLTAGVSYKGLQVIFNYGHGLQRVFPKSTVFEDKFTSRVFSLSAAYLFNMEK